MLIREAMSAFWQTLKDTWEELFPLAIVNLVWLLAWAVPLSLGSVAASIPALAIPLFLIGILAFPVGTAGIYYVTNRVAHAKTFHFSDFLEGVQQYWWRSLLWFLANLLVIFLISVNIWFYPRAFEGEWTIFVAIFWLFLLLFWVAMQIYFWPILIEMEAPRLFLAWRNALYLILANPFYAFFIASFTLVLLAASVLTTLPFIFAGMTLQGLLGNNAVLILLSHFGLIQPPRPKATGGGEFGE